MELISCWTRTSTKNPTEWLIILFALFYMLRLTDLKTSILQFLQLNFSSNLTTRNNIFELPLDHLSQHSNVIMLLRIWSSLHVYKHASKLTSALSKSSKTTRLYTSFIMLSVFLLAINALDTVLNSSQNLTLDTLVVYLLVTDLKFLVTITMHAMTSKSNTELLTKISEGMHFLAPKRFKLGIYDAVAIGTGVFSASPIVQQIAISASTALLSNAVVFFIFTPIILSIFLYSHKEVPESWHESRNRNFLMESVKESNGNLLSLKAKALLLVNVVTNPWFVDFWNSWVENIPGVHFHPVYLDVNQPLLSCILIVTLLYHYLFNSFQESQPGFNEDEILDLDSAKKEEINEQSQNLDQENEKKTVPENAQTKFLRQNSASMSSISEQSGSRDLETCREIFKSQGPELLTDTEVLELVKTRIILPHQLERVLNDPIRGVSIRRQINLEKVPSITNIPYTGYDYTVATKACCENVIGYMPIPLGLAGPLMINGKNIYLPLATTEGALIASTCRGCKAISLSGGVDAICYRNGMTRAPVVKLPNLHRAKALHDFVKSNMNELKAKFSETTRFGKLLDIEMVIQGCSVYMRFVAFTGDAMGMNMISKSTENCLRYLHEMFKDMQVISLSSNFCTDKKPSAINWVRGRGRSVVCEVVIKQEILETVLKTDAYSLSRLCKEKNYKGSALAGSIGGFNAHAANIIAASFIALGQDPAQVVEGSMCMMEMEDRPNGDLYCSCSIPCLEVGVVGGGTNLSSQRASLNAVLAGWEIDEKNESAEAGSKAESVALTIAGFVMAAELSLSAALCTGDLVKSHMKLNRIQVPVKPATTHSIL